MKTIEQIGVAEILVLSVILLLVSICNNSLDSIVVQKLNLLELISIVKIKFMM